MMIANTKLDPRRSAKFLYWQGWAITDIAEHLEVNPNTMQSWKNRDGWDKASPFERIQGVSEYRHIHLLLKPKKTNADYKELDFLNRQMERHEKIMNYRKSGNQADLNPNLSKRKAGRIFKNHISEEDQKKLVDAFHELTFEYQKNWWRNRNHRVRQILKSRQIGATYYFALEAFIDALENGRNKIFLSASKAQAHIFRHYIISFVYQVTGIELRGAHLPLENGAQFYFLGTNSKTAQGYSGDLYIDEFFWIADFTKLNNLASAISSQKKWRRTYISTPSSISHPAYTMWTGEKIAERRGLTLDLSHENLKEGKLLADKVWRQIINIYDAETGGCNLFDIEHLREYEYDEEQFKNLFLCEFIDDTESVFSFNLLQKTLVDSWEDWRDVKPHTNRPYGDSEVWIGYDPTVRTDGAGLCVIAVPKSTKGKFRLLEYESLRGLDFEKQAMEINKLTSKYNVTRIAIDETGIGAAVYQQVIKFFPAATPLHYSRQLKNTLVMKAKHVMERGRFEMDAGAVEVVQAFMSVRRELTASETEFTYKSPRNKKGDHADIAWSIMNALIMEPLGDNVKSSRGFMEMAQ